MTRLFVQRNNTVHSLTHSLAQLTISGARFLFLSSSRSCSHVNSNFFDAIRFVLSDLYGNLRVDERQSLLHEGTGLAVLSAYVELIFDNTDGRIPIDKDEVVLRRSIGLKKDEYFLDRKHVSKADVVNLLESAGFSRSNPYYIVQQGRVNALATMKESERLELLKDIAGTRVYDERRAESVKIMSDTDARRKQIEDVLAYIEGRLAELEEEKEELTAYQVADKHRRCLEYALYDAELRAAKDALEALDNERGTERDDSARVQADSAKLAEDARTASMELSESTAALNALTAEKEAAEEEKADALRTRTKAELDAADAAEKAEQDAAEEKKLSDEADELESMIAAKTKELADVKPQWEEALKEERDAKTALDEAERHRATLYARQGRAAQFSSAKERDTWIRSELASLEATSAAQRRQMADLKKELSEGGKARTALKKTLSNADVKKARAAMEKAKSTLTAAQGRLDEATAVRKELWRRETEAEANATTFKTELEKAERTLSGTMPKTLATGLKAVRRIMTEHNIDGVYGPLLELFNVDPTFATAVEVTAGNSLFHVVVDTDETASRLLEIMNRERAGRLTFMPLNQLSRMQGNRSRDLPDNADAVPMIGKLGFNELYRPAMEQVFGRTLMCRNLEVAAEFSRSEDLNCVTLEGDQVSRKGALTGGFVDPRQSRLEAMSSLRHWREKAAAVSESLEGIKQELAQAEQDVASAMGAVSNAERAITQARDKAESADSAVRNASAEVSRLDVAEADKGRAVEDLEAALAAAAKSADELKEELGTPLTSGLSAEDTTELNNLTAALGEMQRELIAAGKARTELESTKTALESELESNLKKRAVEIETMLAELALNDRAQERERTDKVYQDAVAVVDAAVARVSELEAALEEAAVVRRQASAKMDAIRAQESEAKRALLTQGKKLEELLNQRSVLIGQRDEASRHIRDLGSLPAEAFDAKYMSMREPKLLKELRAAHEELKKYSHVNKKALDQYVSFTEQRDKLKQRKATLDAGAEHIRTLIDVLDQRKDEAIERTFRGVSTNFKKVFSELVPHGSGSVIMLRGNDGQEEGSEDELMESDSENQAPPKGKKGGKKGKGAATTTGPKGAAVASYRGVAVKVSFTGAGESKMLQHLSGGQKSLVALALIFAIQKCDPAPFYLFDELDSALDAAHRTAVANMIRKQSDEEKVQFVVTTFRPELVTAADKHYTISFSNKVSAVDVITQDDALDVISGMEDE